uniref:Monocarboxylate transporter n=1 Tax=Romanomermis culicivorax TaxID=13658 RepID=A0A915K989_ROMCU
MSTEARNFQLETVNKGCSPRSILKSVNHDSNGINCAAGTSKNLPQRPCNEFLLSAAQSTDLQNQVSSSALSTASSSSLPESDEEKRNQESSAIENDKQQPPFYHSDTDIYHYRRNREAKLFGCLRQYTLEIYRTLIPGTFTFAPLIDFLFDKYDWQGVLLILSGILLHLLICGALMRDLEWPEDTVEYKTEKFLRSLDAMSHHQDGGISHASTREPSMQYPYHHPPTEGAAVILPPEASTRKAISLIEIPTFLKQSLIESGSLLSLTTKNQKTVLGVNKELDSSTAARSKSVAAALGHEIPEATPSKATNKNSQGGVVAGHTMTVAAEVTSISSPIVQRTASDSSTLMANNDNDSNDARNDEEQSKLLSSLDSEEIVAYLRCPKIDALALELPKDYEEYVDNEISEYDKEGTQNYLSSALRSKSLTSDVTWTQFWVEKGNKIGLKHEKKVASDIEPLIKNGEISDQQRNSNSKAVLSPTELGGVKPKRQHSKPVTDYKPLYLLRKPPLTGNMQAYRLAYYRGYITYFPRYSARVLSAPALVHKKKKTRRFKFLRLFADCWETVIEDLSLLKDVSFVLFLISNLLLYMFYDMPYVHLLDYISHEAPELNISANQASYLVSIIGMMNTLGMLLCGFVADCQKFNNILWYGASITTCGFCILVVPWLTNYAQFCTICALFGFFISANYTLTSVILVELMSLSDFVYAYGIMCLVQGLGTVFGPPLAGYIYDWTGTYTMSFITGGVALLFSGSLVLFIQVTTWIWPDENEHPERKDPQVLTSNDRVQLRRKIVSNNEQKSPNSPSNDRKTSADENGEAANNNENSTAMMIA